MYRRIAAHPIVAFVLLAYGFTYLVGLPFQFAVAAWLPWLPALWQTYLGRLLVVFGPTVAALVVCSATAGRIGVRGLLDPLRLRRSDLGWCIALPILTLSIAVAAYLLAGVPAETLETAVRDSWPLLLGHFLLQSVLIGVGEEIGWRGWLLPKLLRRRSRITSSAFVGAIWGMWHFPVLLTGFRSAIAFLVMAFALTILLTALWSQTGGSVAVVALAHGAFNAPLFFFESVLGSELNHAASSASLGQAFGVGTAPSGTQGPARSRSVMAYMIWSTTRPSLMALLRRMPSRA